MEAAEVIEMSGARSNVLHMSKMIQIRNVPDDLHRQLKVRAASAGMSLSDYIKKELSWVNDKATFEEIFERTEAWGPTDIDTQEIVDIIREGRGD